MASTFSYAQAAKGIAIPAPKSMPALAPATSAKDVTNMSAAAPVTPRRSSAHDEETEHLSNQPTPARESRQQRSSSKPASRVSHSVDTSSVSSPDLGASSASTVTKDDDASSIPNTSSESAWDNKSQASTSVDKSVEPVEKTSEKVKKGKNAVVKPLQEAPVPAVNIWKLRADEQKAKIQKTTPTTMTNGMVQGQNANSTKKPNSETPEKNNVSDNRKKSRDEISKGRIEARGDFDSKKGIKSKGSEKEMKPTSTVLPAPPNRDQEAWPTPETVIDEDRKKALEKGERVGKERKDSASTATHGKHEWVKVAYTPSVVFNTPLPNAANARRGGRPGGRGGAHTVSRPNGPSSNGVGQSEKNGPVSDAALNGEQANQGRSEEASPQEKSPKSKHAGVVKSPTPKDQANSVNGELTGKTAGLPALDTDVLNRKASTPQMSGQGNNYPPKAQHLGRPSKGRRSDFSGAVERRRDDAASLSKDNTSDDRRASNAAQTDTLGDGERRTHAFPDGPNGHHPKHGRYGSHTGGRERGRGGGRGARGGYANGHQFTNGHLPPMQTSSMLPLGPRSPTTFSPDSNGFFPAPQGKFGRNGHRSQSVATDSFRFQPYQNGTPLTPVQPYNLYEYGLMQPMSAVPYSPYVDQFALFSVITGQVEYYFSVDNLLKDMYLRRHMDSQGFVSLEFIAGFNRIKNLSADLELIKLVCQQSTVIEYRTSEDGSDRLRRKDGWEQWVLSIGDRDDSAQNDGPKELHRPPVPHPAGFDQSLPNQWPVMSPGMPAGLFGNDGPYAMSNGYQNAAQDSVGVGPENLPNGTTEEGSNEAAVVNGLST